MIYSHIPEISCFYSDKPVLNSYADSGSTHFSLEESEAHYEYEMILVTGGKGLAVISHKRYPIRKHSLIFIGYLERHYFIIEEEPYSRYVVSMSSSLVLSNIKDVELASIFIQRPKDFCHVVQLSEPAYDLLLPFFVHLKSESDAKAAFYVSKSASLIASLLIDLYRAHPEAFPRRSDSNSTVAVLHAQRYITDHYKQKITLAQIADQNFISRHALSLAFKNILGISFKDYLISFRITESKKLLITTDLSVEAVAEQVGYGNVNNFVQIFKSREGATPLQYRKRYSSSV